MNTFELLEELLKRSDIEINYCLLQLMLQGKLDAPQLLANYAEALKAQKEDYKEQMSEANASMLSLLVNMKPNNGKRSKEDCDKAIHRALYNLNISRQFMLNDLNEKFGYNEEKDRELSYYWREKNGR